VAGATVFAALNAGGYSLEFRALAAILVWWTVIVGLFTGLLPRTPTPPAALRGGVLLGLLAVLTALSLAWADDAELAFSEVVRVTGYVGLFVLVVLVSRRHDARAWLIGLAAGLLGVALLALASRLLPESFSNDQLATFLPKVSARLSYPIGYWNGLGACMSLAIVLLVGLGAGAGNAAGRAVAVAAIPVPAVVLFLTASRGAVAACAVGLGVLVLSSAPRTRLVAGAMLGVAGAAVTIAVASQQAQIVDAAGSEGASILLATIVVVALLLGAIRYAIDGALIRVRLRRGLGAAAVAALVVVTLAAIIASDPLDRIADFASPPGAESRGRVSVVGHLTSSAGTGRYQFGKASLRAFEEHPLIGIGAGGFASWWVRERPIALNARDAHSSYLETLAELGAPGFLLLVGFFVIAFVTGVQRIRRTPHAEIGMALAALACGAVSTGIDWTWEIPAVFAPVVIAAALLLGSATVSERTPPARTSRASIGYGWRVVTLLSAWIALVAAAIAFTSDLKLRDSRSAFRTGDLVAATGAARDASAVEPWAAGPHLQLALVQERRGDLPAALSASSEAIERARGSWRIWLVRARLLTKAGNLTAAERAIEESRRLNPRSPLFVSPR